MKYLIKILFCTAFLSVSSPVFGLAQESLKKSQFEVGIENTRLLYGKYIYDNHLTAKLNVSVYSENIAFQYIRATIGYQYLIKDIKLIGEYFFGSTFNGNYYNTGAVIKADALFFKRLLIDAALAPWYDSGIGYTTCYEAKLGCKITRHIDVKAGYTTIPQYRMAEGRYLFGFDFHTTHLSVSPYLSVGPNAASGGKNIRIVFAFGYRF